MQKAIIMSLSKESIEEFKKVEIEKLNEDFKK